MMYKSTEKKFRNLRLMCFGVKKEKKIVEPYNNKLSKSLIMTRHKIIQKYSI